MKIGEIMKTAGKISFLLTAINCCGAAFAAEPTIIGVNNGDSYGSWTAWATCPDNYYAARARTRIESKQGNRDDTSLNAVALMCISGLSPLSSPEVEICPHGGLWGDWGAWSPQVTDPFKGFQLVVEPPQGSGDDTGANIISFTTLTGLTVVPPNPNNVAFGAAGNIVTCPNDAVVIGIRVRFEENQGKNGDDTALNNVELLCQARPIPEVISGGDGSAAAP